MKHRRRTRRIAASEEDLLRHSRILAEKVLEPLRNIAYYGQDLKKSCDGIVNQDEGFLFLMDDTGFDMEQLEEILHEITREFRAIQVYKGQHDDLAKQFQDLSEESMGPAPRR